MDLTIFFVDRNHAAEGRPGISPRTNSTGWLSKNRPRLADLGNTNDLFPAITKSAEFWLRKAFNVGQFDRFTERDLETKMEALMIKHENDKPNKDIEYDIPVCSSKVDM